MAKSKATPKKKELVEEVAEDVVEEMAEDVTEDVVEEVAEVTPAPKEKKEKVLKEITPLRY